MLSNCREFISYHRPRVSVDGATSVFGPLVILYTSEMFELVENRLYAYADDSTLQALVHKPAARPAVAASLNRDFARIQEWCNRWCMILNPKRN